MKCLQNDTIHIDVLVGDLFVEISVVIFGKVNCHVEGHSWEALFESRLQAILSVFLITPVPKGDYASFSQGSLVQLIKRSIFAGGAERSHCEG